MLKVCLIVAKLSRGATVKSLENTAPTILSRQKCNMGKFTFCPYIRAKVNKQTFWIGEMH